MSTTATTQLPPGIYYIVVAGGSFESQRLTDGENHVTILPPSIGIDPKQEWQIFNEGGIITITRASLNFPPSYLTYQGAPAEKPKAGDRIVVQPERAPFPPTKWSVRFLPIFRALIQAEGTDLGIAIGPPRIQPPFLALEVEGQLEWRFELVRRE